MLERPFWYAGSFAISANQIVQNAQIAIRQNADFYLRGLAMFNASGAVAGRFRRADGSWFTGPEMTHLSGFLNTGNFARPTPIYPQIVYPKNGAFVFDMQDLGGAGDATIFPVLIGVERYELEAPPLDRAVIEHRHQIKAQATVSGVGAQVLEIPLVCETGDPFVIREIVWTATGTEPTTMHVRMWDEHGAGFMNTWVPLRQWAAAGSNNNANQPYPAVVFPEITIPARGRYTLDFFNTTEAGPFTVEVTFKGVVLKEIAAA